MTRKKKIRLLMGSLCFIPLCPLWLHWSDRSDVSVLSSGSNSFVTCVSRDYYWRGNAISYLFAELIAGSSQSYCVTSLRVYEMKNGRIRVVSSHQGARGFLWIRNRKVFLVVQPRKPRTGLIFKWSNGIFRPSLREEYDGVTSDIQSSGSLVGILPVGWRFFSENDILSTSRDNTTIRFSHRGERYSVYMRHSNDIFNTVLMDDNNTFKKMEFRQETNQKIITPQEYAQAMKQPVEIR